MKKWPFWCSMFAVLLLHGGIFFKASANAMGRGLDGADNQAGLLFVPILWIAAVYVLAALVVLTLVRGRGIAKDQTISVLELFRLSGCSAKEKNGQNCMYHGDVPADAVRIQLIREGNALGHVLCAFGRSAAVVPLRLGKSVRAKRSDYRLNPNWSGGWPS